MVRSSKDKADDGGHVQYQAHVAVAQDGDAADEAYLVYGFHQGFLYDFFLLEQLVYHKAYRAATVGYHNDFQFYFRMQLLETPGQQPGLVRFCFFREGKQVFQEYDRNGFAQDR